MQKRQLITAGDIAAASQSEGASEQLRADALSQATGDFWLVDETYREVPVSVLSGPVDSVGMRVDDIEGEFAASYDQEEYVNNDALRVLSVAELSGIRLPAKQNIARVLDVGCGTGRVAVFLAAKGSDVLAFDQTQAYGEITAEKLSRLPSRSAQVAILPMERLNFLDELDDRVKFDAVTCMFAALNHSSDVPGVIEAMAERLKPGGVLNLSMYGSPEALIVQALAAQNIPYEPSILIRRAVDGILLGEAAKEVLPAQFPYPKTMAELISKAGLVVEEAKPLIPLTAFYPREATPDNLASFGDLVSDRFDRAIGRQLVQLRREPCRALWTSALADQKIRFTADEGAYYSLTATKDKQ